MRLDKADQLLCYMNEAPIGPGFVSEVEDFLSDTGIGHRRFGSNATGDPLFVIKPTTGRHRGFPSSSRCRRGCAPTGARWSPRLARSHCPIVLSIRS